jgi:hypothetical protein
MMTKRVCLVAMVGLAGLVALTGCSHKPTFVSGSLEQFQPVTLDFNGPSLWEVGPANPFIDYRMTVQFTKGKRVVTVPGYYAADGQAADTSAAKGHVWRAHFLPDEPGEWKYVATLDYGVNAAIDDAARTTTVSFSGAKGKLNIAPLNGAATGFGRTGPLRYVNCRYARFDNNQPFIINGVGSPENLLAYEGFGGTVMADQFLHHFLPHMKDWSDGDPSWQDGKGMGIIGAVNYLASQGVNCLSFSTYNIDGGHHGDVWVWSTPADKRHLSVSRLAQWDIVFTHMSRLGVAIQLVTQEAGNDNRLGGGELLPERKLYYRELVARFAHHPGLIWNLGQNNGNTDIDRAEFAAYIHRLDPYKHPIVIHAADGRQMEVFTPLLGFHALGGIALESPSGQTNEQTLNWLNRSAERNQKWMVTWSNASGENPFVRPDADDPTHDVARQGWWANVLAGGSGAIWSMGPNIAAHEPASQDFRRFERLLNIGRASVDFVQENVPLIEMVPANPLVKSDGPAYCLASRDTFLVYLAQGQSARLTAPAGRYEMIWFNPRTGGATGLPGFNPARVDPDNETPLERNDDDVFEEPADTDAPAPEPAGIDNDEPLTAVITAVEAGSVRIVESTGELLLTPPANDGGDWVVLIRACR